MTEGNYNILNPSVYVSMRQEMNDDSLYIRAASSTQHEEASVAACWRTEIGFNAK